jgi:hypothetical protein
MLLMVVEVENALAEFHRTPTAVVAKCSVGKRVLRAVIARIAL